MTSQQMSKANPPRRRWFEEGELTCSGPGCERKLPAGYYGMHRNLYLCSNTCTYRYNLSRRKPVRCTYCKAAFIKKGTKATQPFCSQEHLFEWRKAKLDKEKAGRFAPILREYIETFAPRFYAETTLNALRCDIAAFFAFLSQEKIRSLNSVTPQTITKFLIELSKKRPKSAGSVAGIVRVFFDWVILIGRRKSANPVLPKIHGQRRTKHLPRPYSKQEIELIWKLLDGGGDMILKTAVALGLESGLRIGEVCNLRVQDVDLDRQELFVRLPNKTSEERLAPFHNHAKECLVALLDSRGSKSHEFLLTSPTGLPMKSYNLRKRVRAALQGSGKIQRFEFHRLRHSAATRMINAGAESHAVMKTFGWRNPAVMAGYAKLLPDNIRASYDAAMKKAITPQAPKSSIQSLDEFCANSDQ